MIRFLANRWMHFTLLSIFVLFCVGSSFPDTRLKQELENYVFDNYNQLYPREKTDKVIIVDYDDESLKRVGQWPWPRTKIAQLVDNLTAMGAQVIAFDGVLAEEDASSPKHILNNIPEEEKFQAFREEILRLEDHDDVLARSIEKAGMFIAGFTGGSYSQSSGKPVLKRKILMKPASQQEFLEYAIPFNKAATFLPTLQDKAFGNGSFLANPDFDGILRNAGLIFSDGNNLFPSLSLEAIRALEENKKEFVKIEPNPDFKNNLYATAYLLTIGTYKVPIQKDGIVKVYYRPFDESGEDYISAYKILDNDADAQERIKDKIVLIGSSAEGLKDLRSTSIEKFQPGVEIHANIIEQILQEKYLLRPLFANALEAVFVLFIGVLLVLMSPFVSVVATGAISVGLMSAAFAASYVGYIDHGYLIDPVYPSLCIFLIFVTSTLLTYLRTEYERGQIRDAFGLYISPEYMKELTENPEKLKLGGENRILTVMFTDIRNFTGISEGLSPEELIQLMNDFLTPMSDLVMQNKGTIDKYMGDAMMAFWNAPLDDVEHARHACLTALGMQKALDPINERLTAKARELGKEPVLLNAGIGINTGLCAVGNMGSRQRFAYSALGDSVNVASRLEGQTKTYGAGILIGERTWELVKDMACLEVDLLQAKGKTKPEKVFALLGDKDLKNDHGFDALYRSHQNMIKAYRDTNFVEAQRHLEECIKLDFYNLNTLYSLYKERITAMIQNPPAANWDGIYVAKTK